MGEIFSDLRKYAKNKVIETEIEVEKIILYVSPLMFIFFTSKKELNYCGYICIYSLLFSMILSFWNLLNLKKLFIVYFNNALESEKVEDNFNEYLKGLLKKEDVGNLPDISEIGSSRKLFDLILYFSVGFFIFGIFFLLFFIAS